uniref:G_PROTEIN_RECEP_F1_2 domain-containing protein n=1 Tax=Panagrellus redivivus TaxID=6233 RepID=A0A7E4VI34_PANRE
MDNSKFDLDTFFTLHRDHRLMIPALIALCIILTLDVIGITTNFFVVFVTFRSSRLRNTTNYFICLSCIFDSLHVLAHFYLGYVVVTGSNFEGLQGCLYKVTLPLIGLNMGVALIVMTSFDRLLSVLLPNIHASMHKGIYIGGVLTVCASYTAYILGISYLNAAENPDLEVICLIVEAMHGHPSTTWAATTCGSTLIAVFNYVIIGVCIKLKIGKSETTERLYKSLTILTVLMMSSWFISCLTMVVIAALNGSESMVFYAPLCTGITINVACGANFFVLFKFSSEYRSSIKSQAAKWGLMSGPSKIGPITVPSTSQIHKQHQSGPSHGKNSAPGSIDNAPQGPRRCHPMGKRSSYTKTRTRKEKALRYVLRRRPCVFILFIEIAFLLIFTAICIICSVQYVRLRRQHLILKAEDDLLRRMGSHITFAHCDYEAVEDFNTDFCETRIREESYAYRHFALAEDETQQTCIDRQEQVVCHEELDNKDGPATWVFSFEEDAQALLNQCPGLLKTSMPYAKFNENQTAFIPNNVRLAQYKGKYVLAQELVSRCPHCSVRTRQFLVPLIVNGKPDPKCYVKLKTLQKGWPAMAEQCDDVNIILHASDECEEAAMSTLM